MAWYNSLKDLTGDIGKGATAVGHAVGSVASNPLVEGGLGLLTGGLAVPVLAGLGGGLLKPGGNLGRGLVGGAEGLAAGKLGNALGGLTGLGAGGGAAGSAGAGGLGGIAQALGGAAGAGQSGALGGDLGSLLGGLGGWLGGNGGKNALGAAQAVNQALLQRQANQYATNAMGDVNAQWNAQAPLRAQAFAAIPQAINANPFSRVPTPAPGMAQPVGGR